MLAAFGALPPARFDFRTTDALESRRADDGTSLLSNHRVWDWTFSADPARAIEFLDVTGASAVGVSLTGSGITTVTTGRYFSPGQIVTLTDGMEAFALADAAGRISFRVDLGPPHALQQYTPAALALEAAGGYWTSRTVTFDAES